ncbi:MAG: hypothetical protein ACJ75S_07115 [Solirubrobacterales bacterium]|jgi:hypothetical protein
MTASVSPIRPDMLERILPTTRPPLNLASHGYRPAYRVGDAPDCPGCHRSHWLVGRVTAECAFCGTALPIVEG